MDAGIDDVEAWAVSHMDRPHFFGIPLDFRFGGFEDDRGYLRKFDFDNASDLEMSARLSRMLDLFHALYRHDPTAFKNVVWFVNHESMRCDEEVRAGG
jgi:hypothetical protein